MRLAPTTPYPGTPNEVGIPRARRYRAIIEFLAACRRVSTNSCQYLRLPMQIFTAVIEKCSETGLYVGYVPGFDGAHSQGRTLDELNQNLQEVVSLLLDDSEPHFEAQFVGTQQVAVA
jgi:predicted RNase H-like HicB family nuclease